MFRWEASAALRKVLVPTGLRLDGAPGGWAELYRVYRECKVNLPFFSFRLLLNECLLFQFVEDEGDIVFYKNAHGLAKMRPGFNDVSDSGIEVDK